MDQLYLPAALTAKLAYVQAVLFKENRDFAKSMEKARRAQLLSQVRLSNETQSNRKYFETMCVCVCVLSLIHI